MKKITKVFLKFANHKRETQEGLGRVDEIIGNLKSFLASGKLNLSKALLSLSNDKIVLGMGETESNHGIYFHMLKDGIVLEKIFSKNKDKNDNKSFIRTTATAVYLIRFDNIKDDETLSEEFEEARRARDDFFRNTGTIRWFDTVNPKPKSLKKTISKQLNLIARKWLEVLK